jgi:hypothetical protein
MTPDHLFAPFDTALEDFHRAGGKRIVAIRAPRQVVEQFKTAFPVAPERELRYQEAPVHLVESQDVVSIRGTTSVGHAFEWPEPDMAWAAQDA